MGERESGHAVIESLFLGLVLLVPVMWMLSVFGELHGAALATASAAREAGFEGARSVDLVTANEVVTDVVQAAVEDHGLDPDRVEVAWTAGDGWQRGGTVEIVVTYRVSVFQAPLLGAITEPAVAVSARHVAVIDRYRSRDG